nr:hypothetical protein [uncultured Cohaesibacter sp.]
MHRAGPDRGVSQIELPALALQDGTGFSPNVQPGVLKFLAAMLRELREDDARFSNALLGGGVLKTPAVS